MSPPSFPITPEGLRGSWAFNGLAPGRSDIGGFGVTAAEVAHKGGRTYGYRVEDHSGSIAYLPDHSPTQGCSDDVLAMIRGVDLLLHDAQFFETERSTADLFGHSTVEEAIELATAAGAGTLVLFHHGPNRTDDELDLVARNTTASMPVLVAREGMILEVYSQQPSVRELPAGAFHERVTGATAPHRPMARLVGKRNSRSSRRESLETTKGRHQQDVEPDNCRNARSASSREG